MNRRSFLKVCSAVIGLLAVPRVATAMTVEENPYLGKEHIFYIEHGDNSWLVPITTIKNINRAPGSPPYIPGPHAFMFYVDYVEDKTQEWVIKDKNGVFTQRHPKPFTKHLANLRQLHKELKIHEPKNLW